MKNFFRGANFPLFLIAAHLGHISYLHHVGSEISISAALIIGILVLFYGVTMYFEYNEKPDYDKIMEEKYEEFIKGTQEKIERIESKVSSINLTAFNVVKKKPIDKSDIGW